MLGVSLRDNIGLKTADKTAGKGKKKIKKTCIKIAGSFENWISLFY